VARTEKAFHIGLAEMNMVCRDADGDGNLAGLQALGDGLINPVDPDRSVFGVTPPFVIELK